MKIFIITTIFPPDIGGPATYIKELASKLTGLSHEVHVFTYGSKKYEELNDFFIHKAKILNLPKVLNIPLRLLNLTYLIIKLARKYSPDVIYTFNVDLAGLPAYLASKISRKPLILRTGGDYVWEVMYKLNLTSKPLQEFYEKQKDLRFSLLKLFQKIMLHKFKYIIVDSYFYKSILAEYYSLKNITVIQNPVKSYNLKKQKQKKFTIITASRLLRLKGVQYLLKSIQELSKKTKNIRLIIVGEGPYKKNLIKLCKELKIESYTEFKGYLQHDEVIRLINNSNILVLPSVSEIGPNVVLEAMSVKTAVISTKNGGANELIGKDKGLLVPIKDPESITLAIEKIMKDKILKSKLEKNAYESVKNLSWDKTIKETLGIIEQCLK